MDFNAIINNFKEIVTNKYYCFCGRANRFEFWAYVLVTFVISLVFGFIPGTVGTILKTIVGLALLLPGLGVTARRLHDVDKSGWFQLLYLVPFVGAIIVLVLCIPEGSKESNQYGDPIA